MESSIDKSLGESTITASPSNEFCTLHQLNSDCILKICEYLSVTDLVELSKLDSYYCDLITSQFIAKKLIDVGVTDIGMPHGQHGLLISAIDAFTMFGKFMKKIIVRSDDFRLFLRIIERYCQPGTLTEVDLKSKISSSASRTIVAIDLTLPIFSKLRRLTLSDIGDDNDNVFQEFLVKLANSKTNLEILELHRIDVKGGWLQKLGKLRELRINAPRILSLEDLSSCFRANPKLRLFEYTGSENLMPIYNTLPRHCPELETFNDYHTSNVGCQSLTDVSQRYTFLSQLNRLRNVTLTSYTATGHDLDYHMRMPALVNLSKIKVYFNAEQCLVLNEQEKVDLLQSVAVPFHNLKMVEIETRRIGNGKSRWEYICNVVTQHKNVEKVKVTGRTFTKDYCKRDNKWHCTIFLKSKLTRSKSV